MGSTGVGLCAPLPRPFVICCMCGDRGLPGELFRCKVCVFRSQHKYCSDLYPKAEAYKACNWCLREEKGKALAWEAAMMSESGSCQTVGVSGTSAWKLHRVAPALQLSKPVKKQRAPEQVEKMRREELSPGVPPARVRQAFRGKVRRYKLLEEVSS